MARAVPYKARKDHKAGDPAAKPKCCKGEERKAEDACSIDAKENTSFVENQEERNKKREKYNANPKHKKKKDIYAVRDKTWKDKHCMNTLFDYENTANVKKNLEKLKDELDELKDDFDNVLLEFGKGAVVDKVEKVVAVGGCAVVGGAVGGIIGFFFGGAGAVPGAVLGAEIGGSLCGVAATADTVLDAAKGAKEIWNNKEKIAQKIEELSSSKKQVDKLNKTVTVSTFIVFLLVVVFIGSTTTSGTITHNFSKHLWRSNYGMVMDIYQNMYSGYPKILIDNSQDMNTTYYVPFEAGGYYYVYDVEDVKERYFADLNKINIKLTLCKKQSLRDDFNETYIIDNPYIKQKYQNKRFSINDKNISIEEFNMAKIISLDDINRSLCNGKMK